MTPIQLLKGHKVVKTESVASFIKRITSDWEIDQGKSTKVSGSATKIV